MTLKIDNQKYRGANGQMTSAYEETQKLLRNASSLEGRYIIEALHRVDDGDGFITQKEFNIFANAYNRASQEPVTPHAKPSQPLCLRFSAFRLMTTIDFLKAVDG